MVYVLKTDPFKIATDKDVEEGRAKQTPESALKRRVKRAKDIVHVLKSDPSKIATDKDIEEGRAKQTTNFVFKQRISRAEKIVYVLKSDPLKIATDKDIEEGRAKKTTEYVFKQRVMRAKDIVHVLKSDPSIIASEKDIDEGRAKKTTAHDLKWRIARANQIVHVLESDPLKIATEEDIAEGRAKQTTKSALKRRIARAKDIVYVLESDPLKIATDKDIEEGRATKITAYALKRRIARVNKIVHVLDSGASTIAVDKKIRQPKRLRLNPVIPELNRNDQSSPQINPAVSGHDLNEQDELTTQALPRVEIHIRPALPPSLTRYEPQTHGLLSEVEFSEPMNAVSLVREDKKESLPDIAYENCTWETFFEICNDVFMLEEDWLIEVIEYLENLQIPSSADYQKGNIYQILNSLGITLERMSRMLICGKTKAKEMFQATLSERHIALNHNIIDIDPYLIFPVQTHQHRQPLSALNAASISPVYPNNAFSIFSSTFIPPSPAPIEPPSSYLAIRQNLEAPTPPLSSVGFFPTLSSQAKTSINPIPLEWIDMDPEDKWYLKNLKGNPH